MAGEANPPVIELGAGLWLSDVVEHRAPSQPHRSREAVGERLGEQRRDRRAALVAEQCARLELDIDCLLQNLKRVLVCIEVVVSSLLDALQRAELRQNHRYGADLVEKADPFDSGRRAQNQVHFGEDPLAGDGAEPAGAYLGRCQSFRINREAQLNGEAGEPDAAQRIGGKRIGAGGSKDAKLQIFKPSGWIDQLAAR